MPRIRTIKPNFWEHEEIAQLPPYARLLFIASWNFADDEGRLRWSPAWLSRVFPYDLERGDITFDDLREWMALLEDYRMIQSYVAEDGQRYACIVNFRKHQVVPKATPSRLPAPPPLDAERPAASENRRSQPTPLTVVEDSGRTPVVLPEASGVGSRKQEVGSRKKEEESNPPAARGGAGGNATVAIAVQPPLMIDVEVAPPPAPPNPRGTRLSEDWKPNDATAAWTRANSAAIDIHAEWAKFQDYWLSRAGSGARKVDWDRTWKSWVRKANEDAQRRSGRSPSGLTPKDQKIANILAMGQRMQAQADAAAEPRRRAIEW